MGLAFAVSDTRLTVSTIADWRAHGPAIVGLVAAVAAAMGLRSGSHGGPLVFEAADVQHVLLAPVDRGTVVRASPRSASSAASSPWAPSPARCSVSRSRTGCPPR